ncbi:hypothetical protein AR540_01930 [Pseudomonas sp. EpS/L25]|nr:hypothetical protein AR540_01930 [Pseudomonas sp. EpS/L25]
MHIVSMASEVFVGTAFRRNHYRCTSGSGFQCSDARGFQCAWHYEGRAFLIGRPKALVSLGQGPQVDEVPPPARLDTTGMVFRIPNATDRDQRQPDSSGCLNCSDLILPRLDVGHIEQEGALDA